MPHLTFPITAAGCELDVYVGVSKEREEALKKATQTVPPLSKIRMIVDTGATGTAIDESVLKSLGLTPTGTTQILTPSTKGTPVVCATYDILLAVYHAKFPLVQTTLPVIASDFTGQTIQGLIGCDVLRECLLVLDGASGQFTLAF
jgi:predicted aspartyl protease